MNREENILLDSLNSPFGNSPLEIILGQQSAPSIITFESKLKNNPYVLEGNISYKEEYYTLIKKVCLNFGYEVSFNNSGRIFWVTKKS